MAYDPKVRASDEDRDRTETRLREHHALGRITAEEFNERLDKLRPTGYGWPWEPSATPTTCFGHSA